MRDAASPLPAALSRGFLRVDDPLLVARYRAGLEAIGAPATRRSVFHLDAAGYSPEIAAELGDPFYLGGGALEARALIVAAEQLAGPLVHPSLGFAADAFRRVGRAALAEIREIILREPLIAEIHPEAGPLGKARELADVAGFEMRFRTPGGLVEGVSRLEELGREFLESDRLWLDDEFIAELAKLAERVRGLPPLPKEFAASRHPLGLFFCPAFGGSYRVEEPGASFRSATTSVLTAVHSAGEAAEAAERSSARGRRVEIRPLEATAAVELLERHRIARFDRSRLRERPEILERLQHWIAVDRLLARDPARPLPVLGPREVAGRMREEADPPAEHRELEDLARRIRSELGPIDPAALSPTNRLRLLAPVSTRPAVRRFVRHLRAFLDPLDLGSGWCHAPDVFFARLVSLPAPHRAYFTCWLAANEAWVRREIDTDG